jgi:PAS domain S-box-containing protein
MSIVQHFNHRIAFWGDWIKTLLHKDNDAFDVLDFRVGTLVGTVLIGFVIPLVNLFSDFSIVDYSTFRYSLVVFQLALVIGSYYFTFVKRYANEFGNLCSLIYGVFCITYAYLHDFAVIETSTMLIALFCLCGMFKNKFMLRLFMLLSYAYLCVLVVMTAEIVAGKMYIIGLAGVALLLAYYTFSVKIDIIEKLVDSQEHIRMSEQRFRSIFDNAPLGVALLDGDFKPTRFNQFFTKEFGYSEAELQRKGLQSIVHPQDVLPSIAVRREMANSENGTFEREQRFLHKSGEILWVRVSMSYVQLYAQSYIIAMFDNITREKNAEFALQESSKQLQSHNEALEEFSYVISHDLQEPLRMITSFTQLIQRKHLPKINDASANNDFNYVVDGAKRMSGLIHDMLEYSRWSAKDLPMEEVNTQEAIAEVLQTLTVAIERADAVVICEDFPTIRSNKMLLQQVFQNLISNSIKYRHPERSPEIDVLIQDEALETHFAVSDNGLGFEERDRDRIFGIFQRLDTDKTKGNGMGLAICKRLIEKQGGSIWAESIAGEGSTFHFTLPKPKV